MAKNKVIEVNKLGAIEISGIRPLDKYYLITGKDYLLLKKIQPPAPIEQLEGIAMEIQTHFKNTGIKKSDVTKAVKWARKK